MTRILSTLPSKRLYVSDLPADVSFEQIKNFFSRFGPCDAAGVGTHKKLATIKGVSFVEFNLISDATKAVECTEIVIEGKRTKCKCRYVFTPARVSSLPRLDGAVNTLVVECDTGNVQRYCEYLHDCDQVVDVLAVDTTSHKQGSSLVLVQLVEGAIEDVLEEVCKRPGFIFYARALYPCTNACHTGTAAAFLESVIKQKQPKVVRTHKKCSASTYETVEQKLGEMGWGLDPRKYEEVVVLVEMVVPAQPKTKSKAPKRAVKAGEEEGVERLMLAGCVSPSCFQRNLSPSKLQTELAEKHGGKGICRAYHKLREVGAVDGRFAKAAQAAERTIQPPVYLDVGASPGGWTLFLAEQGCRVVAVDPGALDERVLMSRFGGVKSGGNGSVQHLRMMLQDALGRGDLKHAIAALAYSCQGKKSEALLDGVVCDANVHPHNACDLMVALAPLCKPGAILVLTLKLPARLGAFGFDDLRMGCDRILDGHWDVQPKCSWLYANSGNERTIIVERADVLTGKPVNITSSLGRRGSTSEGRSNGASTTRMVVVVLAVTAVAALLAVSLLRKRR
jgi:hypothetical protein